MALLRLTAKIQCSVIIGKPFLAISNSALTPLRVVRLWAGIKLHVVYDVEGHFGISYIIRDRDRDRGPEQVSKEGL